MALNNNIYILLYQAKDLSLEAELSSIKFDYLDKKNTETKILQFF